MKRKTYFFLILLFGLLAACSPTSGTEPEMVTPATPAATPESVAAVAAQDALATAQQVATDGIEVVAVEAVEWPDACLGLAGPEEMCAQVITPGYRVTLAIGEQQFVFHTDAEGLNLRMVETAVDEATPGAALNVRQVLATQQQLALEQVDIVNVEAMEWPDACLGLPAIDEMCAQMITPGYRVTLAIGNLTYVYHTDVDATQLRLAEAPPAPAGEFVMRWQGETEMGCQTAVFTYEYVSVAPCDGHPVRVPYAPPARGLELLEMAGWYAPFTAETPNGQVEWQGSGAVTAVAVQQRALAEWAETVWRAAATGHSAASDGLAFAWHREGGIAGFCDDLEVTRWGMATLSQCGGTEPQFVGQARLSSEQLALLYALLDEFAPFEQEETDSATADGMTIRMVVSGTGSAESSTNEWLMLQELAQTLAVQAGQPINPDAAAVVQEYLVALAMGDYETAVGHFGGSYETLIGYNPDVDPTNEVLLFERGCTVNGFQCLLVRNVVETAVVLPDGFRVFVEFSQPDGSLFVQGPCCGATPEEMPPTSQFSFTVLPDEEGILRVTDLPVYTP